MAKRLAITIAGAVSLGSYEAGVLYEIIHALGMHNADARTRDDQRIVIDVITGASAGGMTATLATQKLLFDAPVLREPYANALYGAWVKDIDLARLLRVHGDDDALKSILSSQLVVDLSKRSLTDRYAEPAAVLRRTRHPAASEVITLGLAMSNLNGVDYGLLTRPKGDPFVYTRYQDQWMQVFDSTDPASSDTLASWEPIRNAAVSCGAFPFAFRAVDAERRMADFPGRFEPDDRPIRRFTYTDGGTFDNEPLGLAKDIVDTIDKHVRTESRFYLFVAPRSLASTAAPAFSARSATYVPFAKRLVSAIFDEGAFQDWVTAEKVNKRVARFNERATALMQEIERLGPNELAALRTSTAMVLRTLFAPLKADGGGEDETESGARTRLKTQFKVEYEQLPEDRRDVWIDAVLTVERAAELGPRDEMAVYAITALAAELASNELFAFAGFFDQSFRDHDYDVGRKKAQDVLSAINAGPDPLGPIHFEPEPIRPIDATLDGLTFERMNPALREEVREKLRARAGAILEAAGIDGRLLGAVERKAIDLLVVKPALDRILEL